MSEDSVKSKGDPLFANADDHEHSIFGKIDKILKSESAISEKLLNELANDINYLGENLHLTNALKQTPLHIACQHKHNELFKIFVEKSDINAQDIKGFTPLHEASASGGKGIVSKLLEKGANITMQDNLQRTPLHYGCLNGHQEVASELIKKGYNNACDYQKRTPLHYACINGKIETVRLLLSGINAEDINMQDKDGKTPLHLAALNNSNDEVVRLLIEKEANIGMADMEGNNILHSACKNGNADIIQFVFDQAPKEVLEAKNKNGEVAKNIAMEAQKNLTKAFDPKSFIKRNAARDVNSVTANNTNGPHYHTKKNAVHSR